MMIISNLLFIRASSLSSFSLLVLSQFLFGFGGSKVVHRRYIANYVSQRFWNEYYKMLVYLAFVGMITGPLIVILISYIASHFQKFVDTSVYLVPGYVGIYLTVPFLIVFSWKFNQPFTPSYDSTYADLNARNDHSFNTQINEKKPEDS